MECEQVQLVPPQGTHSTMTLKPNQCYEVPGSLSAKFNGGVPGKGYMMLCTDMLCRGLCALRTRADWYYPNNLIYDAGAPVYSAKWFA
ncbi:hypothetical protein AX774_g4948 [Zancudomyces culisetae]|uniref:Uncharacterized protein n=1 Tax=Zancudomyces culisetae TaxID=1213189 RepID=A0A1R1PKZ0_ZANCU|nr:hypothetical protein AX774_g4948 [Zancudomyces culisetae]|eukprot:OMH81593.1 hypothetical protein AX774_g4948 [Zancudomyces culisetae]